MNKEFPADNRAFIHIYGDLSYARKAGTATLFFGILPSSAVPPHRILFPLVGRSMRREFGDHKYRNGHGSPLKDAGERRSPIFQGLSERSHWPCEPIPSLRVGRIVHKEYLAFR